MRKKANKMLQKVWTRGFAYLVAVLTVLALSAPTASANAIWITTFFLPSPLGSPADELAHLELNYGGAPLTFLYKLNSDLTTDGPLQSQFTIANIGTPTAQVSWNLAGTGYHLTYILLKDGSIPGRGQLYTLYGVTPDQTTSSNGDQTVSFFDGSSSFERDISHISFYGNAVPEPVSLLLLGTGLAGLAIWRRKK